jgi:hypothetical protein
VSSHEEIHDYFEEVPKYDVSNCLSRFRIPSMLTPACTRHDRLADPPRDPNGHIMDKYRVLENDGLAGVGQRITAGQVYINKQTPSNANDNGASDVGATVSWKNAAMTYRGTTPAMIDKVMISDTDNDQTLIKVLTRQTRRPELGDKFSSRHGQKGVCGLIVEQADMPFNDIGMNPDIIMNPHGFPRLVNFDTVRAYSPAKLKIASVQSNDSRKNVGVAKWKSRSNARHI